MIEKCIQQIMKETLLRFIRILKNKIYKYVTSISKDGYIGKLINVIDNYHNKYHNKIKMKPVDVK